MVWKKAYTGDRGSVTLKVGNEENSLGTAGLYVLSPFTVDPVYTECLITGVF